MTSDEQLALWLKGQSFCPSDSGECCPDFSCCKPEILADEKTRQAFVDGTEKQRLALLGHFLAVAINHEYPEKNIHITQDQP